MMRRRVVGRSIARAAVGTAVVAGQPVLYITRRTSTGQIRRRSNNPQYDQAYQQGAADAQQPVSHQQQPQYYAPPHNNMPRSHSRHLPRMT